MRRPNWRLWLRNKKECRYWMNVYIKKGILRKTSDESRLHIKRANHNLVFANWIVEKHKDEIPNVFNGDTFYDW